MAKINSYPFDSTIQDADAWIGTDSTNRSTKQFTAKSIAEYLNISNYVDRTTDQSIGGIKTFTKSIKIEDTIMDGTKGVTFGESAYYGRQMGIYGVSDGTFDGVQITNELIIQKEANQTGDMALYFRYGNDRVGGIYLDDDTSQQGLVFYVSTTSGNSNIIKKISLREGTTIGDGIATTLPPLNGLLVEGNVGIGNTAPAAKLDIVNTSSTSSSGLLKLKSTTVFSSAPGHMIDFIRSNNTIRGFIGMNQYGVTYSTSSDYRLKRNIVPIADSIDRIKKLKPSRFNWDDGPDDYVVDGFIAHEVADVIPEAITGEKDDVDKNNAPIYQSIDQSKIVPLLTAALQEAVARIEALELKSKNHIK